MRSRILNIISILLLVFIGLAAYYYVRVYWNEFRAIELVSWPYLLVIAMCFAANMTFRGLFSFFVLKAVDVRLTIVESVQLSAVATMANFVLPFRSGAGLRALYLKQRHGLDLTLFVSTMTALYIFFIFVNCLLGMIALTLLTGLREPHSLELFALLAALFLGSGWAIFLAPSIPKSNGKLLRYLSRISSGWNQIRRSPGILFAAMGTTAGTSLSASLGLYGAFRAFGLDIGALGSVLLMASQNVGGLIGLTPGAAGFQEAAGLLFARVLAVTTIETLLVLGAVRLVKIGVALLAGTPSFVILSNRLQVKTLTNEGDR